MADPNPQEIDERTKTLHNLYRDIGQLIRLEEISKTPQIVIDGDIELAWPPDVQQQVLERITARKAEICAAVATL